MEHIEEIKPTIENEIVSEIEDTQVPEKVKKLQAYIQNKKALKEAINLLDSMGLPDSQIDVFKKLPVSDTGLLEIAQEMMKKYLNGQEI